MIHAASLVHDDVVDGSSTRRGLASAPAEFGNKVAVLAGDFMLARAALSLSQLGSPRVIEVCARTDRLVCVYSCSLSTRR